MKKQKTHRGFDYIEFVDAYGEKCSLQKSSLATADAIWLGIDDANPQILIPYQGWQKVEFPEGTMFSTRMHLSRKQVKDLLPHLVKFALTGEI